MKAGWMAGLLAAGMLAVQGCSSMTGGGLLSKAQDANDALAAKHGVPPEVLEKVRAAVYPVLGIVDPADMPDAARVLPEGWTWKRDILDQDGNVVDVSKLRKGPPYVVADGSGAAPESVSADDLVPISLGGAVDPAEAIAAVLEAIRANPDLLAPAP